MFAQSGESNPTHMEQLSRFYDESQVHEAEQQTQNSTGTIPRIRPQGVSINLESFLTRPFLIETFQWTPAQVIRTKVMEQDYPLALRNVSTHFLRHLEGAAWWAPDIEIEVQINSTKFHYGRLIFAVYPFANYMHDNYLLPEGASTWPEWYQISANSQQSLKILVPYRHFYHRVSTASVDNYSIRIFKLKGYVAANLLSAMSDTPAPVTVSIYARCVNPHLSSFSPFSISAQSGENNQVLVDVYNRIKDLFLKFLIKCVPMINKVLDKAEKMVAQSGEQKAEISKLLNMGSSALVPNPVSVVSAPISTSFNNISRVSTDVAKLANACGYSVPVNPAPTNSMQIRQPLFSKIDDMPNSVNLGPSLTATMDTSNYNLVNSYKEEMSLVDIVGHPSLLWTGDITSTTAVGTQLKAFYINPQKMIYGDLNFSATSNTVQPLPFYYIARLFQYWRGSSKIHISFVSSSFHSCRVRFVWNPNNVDGLVYDFPVSQRLNMYNVLMDINQQSDYSILIPYDQTREWLRTVFDTTQSATCANGYFALYLETKLTSTMATPQPIYYQIFFSMADDVQFAGPTAHNIDSWGNPDIRVVAPTLLAVTDEELEETQDDFEFGLKLYAQTGETVLKCEVPSSSAKCLRDTKFVSIMGDNIHPVRRYGESTSYEVSSAKQLANMLTPMVVYSTVATTDFTGRRISPFAYMSFLYNDQMWYCMFNQIRSIFRFARGSFRLAGFISAANIQVVATCSSADNLSTYSTETTDVSYLGTLSPYFLVQGSQYFMSTQLMPADATVPYYGQTPCVILATGTAPTFITAHAVNMVFSNQKSAAYKILYMGAGGDDLMLGTRMGMPRLRNGAYPT